MMVMKQILFLVSTVPQQSFEMHLPPTRHEGDRSARPLEIEGPMDEAAGVEQADQDGQAV
jgi:hypothetical protein